MSQAGATPGFETRRWKLTMSYDGTRFCGWEKQAQGERTVQGTLESTMQRLTGGPVRVFGASRTDAGVHALGQVAVADLPPRWEQAELARALNALTPRDLAVVRLEEVASTFQPQFQARSKTYFYQLIEGRRDDPFRDRYAHRIATLPTPDGLRRTAGKLCGKRDFASLMAAGSPVESTVRHVTAIRIRHGRDWIRVFFTAEGFLYKMIRNMISLMVEAASGKLTLSELEQILAGRDRNQAPPTYPAKGLFLWKVAYRK